MSPQSEETVIPLAGTELEFEFAKTENVAVVTFRTTGSPGRICRFTIHRKDGDALEDVLSGKAFLRRFYEESCAAVGVEPGARDKAFDASDVIENTNPYTAASLADDDGSLPTTPKNYTMKVENLPPDGVPGLTVGAIPEGRRRCRNCKGSGTINRGEGDLSCIACDGIGHVEDK